MGAAAQIAQEEMSQPPVVLASDSDPVGKLVHQRPDLLNLAGRENPAPVDEDELVGHDLDFVEHVGGDDDALAVPAELEDKVHDLPPADGIRAGERLVKYQ